MVLLTMTIIEEENSEYRSELKLWRNADGKIWIQVGYDETDPYATQGIPITTDDAKALINELQRLVKNIEGTETEQQAKQLKIQL